MKYLNKKYADILDTNFDGENLIIDLRYKIPKSAHTMEFLKMMVENKNDYINGVFKSSEYGYIFLKFGVRVEEDCDGNQSLVFSQNAIENKKNIK